MKSLLFVFFLVSGQPGGFTVIFDTHETCVERRADIMSWMPELIEAKPEFIASACAKLEAVLQS